MELLTLHPKATQRKRLHRFYANSVLLDSCNTFLCWNTQVVICSITKNLPKPKICVIRIRPILFYLWIYINITETSPYSDILKPFACAPQVPALPDEFPFEPINKTSPHPSLPCQVLAYCDVLGMNN